MGLCEELESVATVWARHASPKKMSGMFCKHMTTIKRVGSKLKPFFRLLGFICLAVATGLMSANEDISGHDAFYFLMTTMTTVGFGDISPKKGKTRVLVGLGLMFILLASTIPPSLSTNTGGGAMQYGHV